MKRIIVVEWGVTLFFVLSLLFYIINESLLDLMILKNKTGYVLWLSLGIYLGF